MRIRLNQRTLLGLYICQSLFVYRFEVSLVRRQNLKLAWEDA